MTAALLHFPTGRPLQLRTVTLLRLDESHLASRAFFPGNPQAPWAWICGVVAQEAGCREEEVGVAEVDVVTAVGIPVARVLL